MRHGYPPWSCRTELNGCLLTVPADEVPWQFFSLIFYHPAQVKAVTRGTAKPGPNAVCASDTKRISHFLIENCAVRYIPAYYVRFGSKADMTL
jgi:hypothetical protein